MSDVLSERKIAFEEFNKAGNVPQDGFSKDDLKTSAKVKALMKIIELAEKDVKKKASEIFDEFNVDFKITSSDNSKLSEDIVNAINFNFSGDGDKKNLTVALNFNFSKLAQLPPDVVHSVVYSTMYNSLLKKREITAGENNFKFGKKVEMEENTPHINDANFDREGNYVESHPILDFVKKILFKLLGVRESENSSCARHIESDLIESGISPQDLFENPNGSNILAERYGKVVKQGYDQQATNLLGAISQDEFESLKSNDDSQIKAFCEKYARIVLASSNVPDKTISITFNNVGMMGEYIDYGGTKQSVNINIDAVKAMKNPAEVVMILSHELTHSIDSTINKASDFESTGKMGYGLKDNLVGDPTQGIEGVKENESAEVYNYVKHLQEICYRVNPNERSARIGELTALKFMQGMNTDAVMQKYMQTSIDSYVRYQNKTLDNMAEVKTLDTQIKTENGKMFVVSASGEMLEVKSESTKALIKSRIDYLKNLEQRGMINPEQERNAIDIALGVKKDPGGKNLAENGVELGL